MPLPGGLTNHETTAISDKIEDFHQGRIDEQALIHYLTQEVQYKSGKDPQAPEVGSPDWELYHRDGGRPYVAGSWDEVSLNANVGRLPQDTYRKINQIITERSIKRL